MGTPNVQLRSWQQMRQWQVDMLERTTGRSLKEWNNRVLASQIVSEADLRKWLADQGITGYSQMLLVHERFGYPEFFTKTAQELVDAQFVGREQLRGIYDALISVLPEFGEVIIQARKTFTGLQTPRRTFAVIAPVTRDRVDLGLRWEQATTSSRFLAPGSRLGSSVTVKVALHSLEDLDEELIGWLKDAYACNL